jgi:Histidine kinase
MTPPRFTVVESAAGAAGFVASLARRFKPSLVLWAFGLILAQRTLLQLQSQRNVELFKSELLIDSLAIVCLMVAVIVADEAVSRGVPRMRAYLCAVVLGCATAAWAQWELRVVLGWDVVKTADDDGWFELMRPPQVFFHLLLVSAVACFVYVNRRTARAAALRLRAAELGRASSRRRTLESRLQAMQARVEPQFLFNTLAQVRELYEQDVVAAGRMLDDLIAYLRAALPHLRHSSSTLGQEITLVQAWLDIMRVRLGDRLRFDIDVPDAAKSARMPAMMLLPLIDHALVDGLQPTGAGGAIRIVAEAAAGRLRLSIVACGFVPNGQDNGLDGIGERLHALYGDSASFEFERLREGGTRAILEIPYEDTDGSDR